MNTVRHSNDSNWQPLRKRQLSFKWKNEVACMVLASFLGTYLDLYFVGKGIYEFPKRPFPEIYSINIAFTLIVLPIMIYIFLRCILQVNNWGKAGVIFFISLLMPILERIAEEWGLFSHSDGWKHIYTFFGYFIFLTIIVLFNQWTGEKKSK